MTPDDISAFIIAGGRSTRFGEDKALFPFRGKPLIEHVIGAIRPSIDEIALVADDAARYSFTGLPCHPDRIRGLGPFGGIYTALEAATTGRIFVFACDMPCLDAGLIGYMRDLSAGFDVTVPRVGGEFEPLHAVYASTCRQAVERRIRAGERRVVSFFGDVSVREVGEDEIRRFADPARVFMNINKKNDVRE